MTNAQTNTLVFKNDAGDYFLLPQEAFEQGRVPEEHKAELERLIAERGAGGDDVQGYWLPLLFAGVVLVGAAAGYGGVRFGEDMQSKGRLVGRFEGRH